MVSFIRILLGFMFFLVALVPGVSHIASAASTIYVPFDAAEHDSTTIDPCGLAVQSLSPTIATQPTPAQMSLQYLTINPKQAYPNQPVTIMVNVVNTGDKAGQLNVDVKINEQVEQSRMVSVGPQSTMPVKFIVTKTQPGIYNVDVGGQKGSFTILVADSGTASTRLSSNWVALLVGTLIIAAVVIIALAFRQPVG